MALCEEKIRAYIRRLLLSRMRILCSHGFYGLLLMHMSFSVDEELETACTDGSRITFGTAFLDSLSDGELDFVMMHEILHVVLQHCMRSKGKDQLRFNVACDIVANSNILLENKMRTSSITLSAYGESMHLTPKGDEGYHYTAEQVYHMLPPSPDHGTHPMHGGSNDGKKGKASDGDSRNRSGTRGTQGIGMPGLWDDHSRWEMVQADHRQRDLWVKRVQDAAEAISVRDPGNTRGMLPLFAERMLKELRRPQTDWRQVLNEFVQEEIADYSFSPPDRRYDDSLFFLPDFNEKEDMLERILFMIDTSASMSDDMITAAYSEVKGAIDQFNGRLSGYLGFFDAAIIEPTPFRDEEEFRVIRPAGGGGTDFHIIFEYVRQHMQEDPPISIIILTDGFAPFPKEKMAGGIPVLWLLNNEAAEPPWGKVARITVD